MEVKPHNVTALSSLAHEKAFLLERAVESSINSIVIIDARAPGRPLVYANHSFYKTTGYTADEVLGQSLHFLQGGHSDQAVVQEIIHALEHQLELKTTVLNYRKDGTSYWNEVHISPVREANGEVSHFIGVLLDISDKKSVEEQLTYRQTHDALTGCLNRDFFEERVEHDLLLAQRQQQMLVLYYIDIDKFKAVNDALGLAGGDELLQQIAERINQLLDPGDTLARLAADEFALLVPEVANAEEAQRILLRLQGVFKQPFTIGKHALSITSSIGIAAYEPLRKLTLVPEARTLIQHGDMAMYQAKQNGRNTAHWFSQDISQQLSAKLLLRQELHDALEKQQLELYYQPILCAENQTVCAVESLIRWHHPIRGMVSPAEFIPLAEESGQIVAMGSWVLEQACHDITQMNKLRSKEISVAVNISPVQFIQPNFLHTVRDIMQRTGVKPSHLELEITESVLMADEERAIDTIHTLDSMGIKVSLDDFGTG